MNTQAKEIFDLFLMESDKLMTQDLNTGESREYRRGYYAGRLHAALFLKSLVDKELLPLHVFSTAFQSEE